MPNAIQDTVEEILWDTFDGGDSRMMEAFVALYNEAGTTCGAEGHELIDDLLRRYTYVSHDFYDEGIETIATYIAQEFDLTKAWLCATTADHQKDSAQRVLYDISTSLGALGHTNINTANRYDRVQKYANADDSIILLDEFLGTGRSIIGRVNTIRKAFADKKLNVPRIYVYVVAGMDFGLRRLAPLVDAAHPFISLRPGLRGFVKGTTLDRAYQLLDQLESGLAAVIGRQLLPKRGDGECEALYARKRGNCPNSVLPMFWWPQRNDGTKRPTAFSRTF